MSNRSGKKGQLHSISRHATIRNAIEFSMVTAILTILGITDLDLSSGVYIIHGIAAVSRGPNT